MPGYSDQIYNYILKLDPTYKNDVSLQAFKSKMANPSYSKKIYDWIGTADTTFKGDVSFDAFNAKLGYPKKKVTTVSPGSGAKTPSSSGVLSKAVSAGVQKAVESVIKPEGAYRYPGREDALYKKTNNQWYIDLGKTGKYVKINEKNRIDALEKYAKSYTPDIVKTATQVIKDVTKGATQLISKTTAPTAAELQKDVKKEIDYLESQKELSNKEIADIFGWNESDVERVANSSNKTTTPITKSQAANAVPIVKTNTSQPSIEQFSQNVQKVMNDLGNNASEEKKQERLDYYNTKDLQTFLKGEGYDVDVNGDKEDDKTQKALKHSNMKEKMFIDDMYESMDQYDRVYGLVNENMLEMSEEEAVPLLRKYFGKDGFIFNETGIGNYVEVISPGKKKSVFEFNTSDPESISNLRTFLGDTYLAKNEKKKYNDLLNGENVDMDDPRARDKYFYDLVNLIGKNPDKYADIIGDPDNVVINHPIKNAIDRTAYNLKAESIQLNKDYSSLKSRIDRYNANPEKYGNKERAAINNILHDLKVREYNILADQKKLTSMDNSLRRITGVKILESRKQGDWAGVLTSTLGKGFAAVPLLTTQLAMDALPYAVGAENFFDPITYSRLKDIDGYTDLEIEDLGVKKLKQTIYGDLERGIMNVASSGTTTPEYVSDPERNDILKGLSFMTESVGTAMSGGGSGTLQKLGFFAMSYNGMEKEMMDPSFNDMSETEKKLYSVPYGFVIGALERFGYNAFAGGDKSVVNKLASGVIGRTLAGLPKDATISTIKREINKNIGRMVADGVINVAGGAVAEGATEALQKVFEVGEKYAINQIKDKEYFQGIPDISTWEGIKKTYDLAKEDFYYAAIGSLVFSSGVNSLQTMQQYRFNKKTDAEFEVLYNSVSSPFMRSMTELDIKSRLAKGEVTKEEAASQIQALNDVAGRLSRINPNLSLRDKKDSFNLILEKEKLEKEKAPLDEALQAPYNERITEINNELKTIAQNAFQEQTTSEVPVQPESEVSGEMAQGEPQAEPQVTTQEGGEQVIQEEVVPTKKNIEVIEEKARQDVDTYIADIFSQERIGNDIDNVMSKMNNAEYINDSEINSTVENIFNEVESINNNDAYSDQTKKALSEKLMNIAEQIDNYEFRTKTETVAVTQRGTAPSVRETPTTKINAERFFEGQKAEVNGSPATFTARNGRAEAVMENGEVVVLDTPTMIINEGDFEFDDSGVLSAVTVTDRFGTRAKFTGDVAMDLAIKQRENEIGTVNPIEFETVYKEVETKYIKEKPIAREEETAVVAEPTAVEVPVQAQPTATQPTAAEPTVAQPEVTAQEEVDQELEKLRTLIQGTDEEIDQQVLGLDISERNDKVAENIANAAKAISKILPQVEFIVHDTDESYRNATGEVDLEKSSRGTYLPATDNKPAQIHINSKKANNRTASHEVFHAVLLNAVNSNEEAQRLTKSMVNAVMKSMSNIEGQQGLKKYLYDFASNYEDNVRDEEKLAELLGVLATNYKNLEAPSKNIIKKFLERIAKLIGLKPMTDREVVDFMNTMADALYKGEALTKQDISMLPKPGRKNISNIIKRFQSDFSDAFSKLSFVYDKNGENFRKLEEQGYITKDKSLSDFNGKYMFLHQPDAAFSGMIYKDGEILVEGKGGVFYPIKFHKDGYFWASTDKTASKMAEDLNKVFEQNGGVIYMALTSAPYDKLLSSTTMSNAVLDFFSSKAFDKNFKITENQFKVALRNAANNFVIKTVKNDDGKVVSKKVGLQLNLPGNTTIAEMKSAIKEKLNPDNSSFADRKEFVLELIRLMSAQINKNDVSVEQFGKLFSQGIQNKYFKGITKTGKISISAANMRQALSEMLTEPLLKEDIERSKGGQVYAVLELRGKVKGVDSDKHESYPKAIQSEDANNKVTLHILKDRLKWSDVFEDFETNKIVTKDRLKKVYPTSGVSVRGLKLNTGKISPRKQLVAPNGKPSNLNEKQWNQVRTPEFKKWFGDWENDPANASKVVDENGEPLVVYHGSLGEFDEFNPQLLASRTRAKSAEIGFFFSDDKRVADSYVYFGQLQNPNINDLKPIIYGMTREQLGDFQSTVLRLYDDSDSYSDEDLEYLKDDIFGYVERDAEAHILDSLKYIEKAEKFIKSRNINKEFSAYPKGYIYESFLNIRNPKQQNLEGDVFDNTYTLDISKNNDGVILDNAIDSVSFEEKDGGIESKVVIAFKPNQIKSATENIGTFSSKEISIRKQQPSKGINQIISIARNNNISDIAIKKLLEQEGYTDAEIQSAMNIAEPVLDIDEIFDRSNKALQRQYDTPAYKRALRYANRMIFERQEAIKRLIKGINNKDASRAYSMLINKAGASGFASARFKEADKKIYGNLGGTTPQQRKENKDNLDKIIYLRRFIAINENLRKKGEAPYIGMGKFNEAKAREDLQKVKERIGEKKFERFSKRADIYFDVYKGNLEMLYESGRINKQTYENFKDIEYSPIKVIKYIVDDNADPSEVDNQAAKLGINRKDIMKLSKLNENAIIFDSRWLLMMNIHTVAARAFENNMLSSFAKALDEGTEEEREAIDPYIKRNPIIGSKKDGTPKQKYNMMNTPVGYTPVSYFDNGIQKTLVVKDEYAQQLLDIKNLDSSLKFLSALTLGNVLRYFATVGNPLFIIGNVPVDIINAAFFTDVYSPFKPLAVLQASTGFSFRFLQSMAYDTAVLYDDIRRIFNKDYEKERRNKILDEFVSHGGILETLARMGLRPLERNMLLTGTKKAINDTLLNTARATSYLGSKSEIAMRLAVYAKRKKNLIAEYKKENNGESPQGQELDDIMWEAAREGRELIDFSQGGEFVKKADQVIPYLNAAVQGLRKQGRFAVENKVLFASNVLQGMGMFAGIAAYSLANAYAAASDDEEDKDKQNKMVIDSLDSISEHEKSQYHIIFTGKKTKVNGKTVLEYVRIKKLPLFSIATTYAEQFAMRYWINKNGGKYDIDNKLIKLVMEKSMPLLPSEVASRNPMVAALVAYNFNYDFFTKKEVFRNKEKLNINPVYEGIEDDKVEDFFKVIAPALGMSPKRTKAAVEKIITSPSTNPLVHVLYGAMNGIFSDKTTLSEDVKVAGEMILESAEKKMIRYTDPEILRYVREDRDKEEQIRIRSEIYQREQKVNKLIKDKLEKGEKYSDGELKKIIIENFPEYDRMKYFKKYKTRIMFPTLDKQILDIVYEETPEIQAQKLWSKYGNSLEEDEKAEIMQVMRVIKRKISPKVIMIYNTKYKNR